MSRYEAVEKCHEVRIFLHLDCHCNIRVVFIIPMKILKKYSLPLTYWSVMNDVNLAGLPVHFCRQRQIRDTRAGFWTVDNNAIKRLHTINLTYHQHLLDNIKNHRLCTLYRLTHEYGDCHVTFRLLERTHRINAAAPPGPMELAGHVLPARPYWIKSQVKGLGARLRNIEQNSWSRLETQAEQAQRVPLLGFMDPDWDEVSRVPCRFSDSLSPLVRNGGPLQRCLRAAASQISASEMIELTLET
jgi:hypothetical protein